MLFNDNPTSIVIPFKEVSLFFKFYTLRNTDKPSSKGMEIMEFSVIKNGESIFSNNYALKKLNFINYNFLLPSEENIKISIPNIIGFGKTTAKIISFQIEITPDIFLQLDNFNNVLELNTFDIGKLVTTSIVNENTNDNCIIQQENFSVTTNFIKSIKEYNKYLYERLVQAKLWAVFAKEKEIDEIWIANNVTKKINVSHFSKEEEA
ncbi:MAG TPA: hypothetical protein PLJ42_11375 [Chitinophagales bacterium]|jgi:hypothetical protein|nr:hypothetical protein [Chitinophagales bacterium]HQV79224.1 hypothetical protein [Chitinophagales bacterium]HQW80024.1 hypothetical protein [Chitinophagales bacterium]HRB66458.1 hypothetical protein [Chitinophagales bacterium]HRB91841.1 hypothetical protein [Chitinophagales bacterium]